MILIFKILLVALLHLAVFICYPETGPNGIIYLAVSALAWSGFLVFAHAGLKLIKFLGGAAGLVFNLAFFALMLAALTLTLPQRDRITVLKKIQDRRFPDRTALSDGLARLGITYKAEVKKEMKELDLGVRKAVKKMKKD